MRLSTLLCAALLLPGLAACQREKPVKEPAISEVLPVVPLPPGGKFLARSGSEDALLLRFQSPFGVDTVAEYYRTSLSSRGWQLMSDTKGEDGLRSLYASRGAGTPPMWVRVHPDKGGNGTIVEIAGAKVSVDSTGTSPMVDSSRRPTPPLPKKKAPAKPPVP